MILRAIRAVKLLSAIRRERPDLWREINAFLHAENRREELMREVEEDYREYFEGNLWRHSE